MPLWKVTIRDGRFGRIAGTAIAWADDPESAVRAVEDAHAGETSYGEPYVVSDAQPYEPNAATVVVVNYGEAEEPPSA